MTCEFCHGSGVVTATQDHPNSPHARTYTADCPEGCERPPFKPRKAKALCHCCGEVVSLVGLFGLCPKHQEEFDAVAPKLAGATYGEALTVFLESKAASLVARTLELVEA